MISVEFSLSSGDDNWTIKAETLEVGGYGEGVVGTGSFIYVAKTLYATSTPRFWRYDPTANSWMNMSVTGLPTGAFRNGTALEWDNSDYIYALAGARYSDADRRVFFRYTISGDNWTQMANTPGPQGAGDAITWSGYDNYIYAILGSSGHGTIFARYYSENNTWETRTSPPAGTDDGCSLVWTGGTYLYALRGEYIETTPLRDFWRYDIVNDSWATMENIPEEGGVGDGGSLLWIGNWLPAHSDYIYALGGGSAWEDADDNYYRYSISNDNWENLADIPYPITDYVGNRLGFANDHIYYWQGTPSEYLGGGKKFCMYEFGYVAGKWTQTNWSGGATDPTLQVGTWGSTYDNYYQGENVDTSDGDNIKLSTAGGGGVENIAFCGFEDAGDTLGYTTEGGPDDPGTDAFGPTTSNPRTGSKSFEAQDTGGSSEYPDNILFDQVGVSSYDNVWVHVWIDTNWGGFEASDWIRGSVQVDGGSWTEFFYVVDDTGGSPLPQDWTEYTYNVGDAASTVRIRIEMRNSANTEIYYFDDVSITGDAGAGGYGPAAYLESSIYDTGQVATWGTITFDNITPTGTGITVKVKTGTDNDPYVDGDYDTENWSAWQTFDNGADLPYENRYLQYRVELSTTNNTVTPKFSEITLPYTTEVNYPPTSSVNTIAPYWQTSSSFTVNATASDPENDTIENVALWYRYSSDNSSWGSWTWFENDSTSPYSWIFTSPSGDGYYEFYSIARDNNGNTEDAPAVKDALCGVDTAAPSSSADTISPYWRTSSSITITATANDSTSGVRDVTIYSRHSADNSTFSAWENRGTDATSPWSWDLVLNENVYWEFYTRASDVAGNLEDAPAEADALCAVDNVAPDKPTLVSPENNTTVSTSTPTFKWTTVTDLSGVTYTLQVDNEDSFASPYVYYKTGITDNQHTSENTLADGTYYWRVRAVDGAGNLGEWADRFKLTIQTGGAVENIAFCGFEDSGDTLGYTTEGGPDDPGTDAFGPTTSNPRTGSKSFEAQDTGGSSEYPDNILFDQVDVSSYDNVWVHVWIDTNWGGFESSDYIRGLVSVDNGAWTEFFYIYDDTGSDLLPQDWTEYTYNAGDTASTVRVKLEMRNSANTEIYYFDDVSITGS